ncbi:hypothetical protein ACFFHJ_22300 [Planotetraspora thailandica]|uniref:hypothetical protein n=1 Tax=Planotetraspora thailandica TaxID=487172 RepID=UPI0019505481|nr:hypothetical protein [Planotetraspora thailandica]
MRGERIASWRHSWTEPAALVGVDGAPLELTDLAEMAVDPATLDQARAELARSGVDVTAGRHVQQRATADHAEIYAGIVNLMVAKRRTDLLVLSNGLLLVPGVPRLKMRTSLRRMAQRIESGDAQALATTDGNRFIPYEEIVAAERLRRFPVKYGLTLHSGEKVELRRGGESEDVADGQQVLERALQSVTRD